MNNTKTHNRHSFEDIVRRTAFSFLLFSAVLAALLTVSWYMLIPELTHTEVGGTVRSMKELKGYKAELEAQILSLEDQRGSFLTPVSNDLYFRLKTMKESRLRFQNFRRDLRRIITDLVPDQTNVVSLEQIIFNTEKNVAELRGVIRNVGPRSMTVLARFVDDIHALESVIVVEANRYTRKHSETAGFYSPFTLRLRLK